MPLGSLRRGMRLRSLILTVTDRLRPAHMARPLGDNPLLWSTLRGMCVWYGEKAVSARQHHRSKHRPAKPQSPRFTDHADRRAPDARDGMGHAPWHPRGRRLIYFAHLLSAACGGAPRRLGRLRRPPGRWQQCVRLRVRPVHNRRSMACSGGARLRSRGFHTRESGFYIYENIGRP